MTTNSSSLNAVSLKQIKILNKLIINDLSSFNSSTNNVYSFQIIINLFLLPLISSIGFLLNFLCVLVYWRILRVNNDVLYKYLCINSISNSIAMLIDTFSPLALCGDNCRISQTYSAQLFYLYGFIYFADAFETFSSLIDIVLTVDRFAKVSNRLKNFRKISYKIIIFILLLISLLYYIPFILKKEIVSSSIVINNVTYGVYRLAPSEFGKTKFGLFFILIQLILSEVFVLVVMINFNVLLLFSLKDNIYPIKKENKRLMNDLTSCNKNDESLNENQLFAQNNSLQEQKQNKTDYKVTLMIISMSVLNLLGNSPSVIIYTISIFYTIEPALINNLLALSNLSTVLTFTCYIFVFYYFNRIFRNTLRTMLGF